MQDEAAVAAAVANHRNWFERLAEASGGGVGRFDGVLLTVAGDAAALPFPAGTGGLRAAVARCRALGLREVGCWAAEPHDELGRALGALGFQDGWQPHWMAIDLARLAIATEDPRVSLVETVPEYDGYGAALMSLARTRPRRSWHAVARVDNGYAGHAWAHLIGGALGSAGIYDVDVLPRHRRRGLGRALTLAVCRAAAAAGARMATLNATGEGELLYRALGFRSLGHGQTWWLHRAGLHGALTR